MVALLARTRGPLYDLPLADATIKPTTNNDCVQRGLLDLGGGCADIFLNVPQTYANLPQSENGIEDCPTNVTFL